jgi:uncharacterized membrane protein (Fun14 family)
MFNFDFTQLFDVEVLMEVLVFLFGLATLISLIVSGLKARGVIPDGAAGKWLGALTLLISVFTGIITQLGYGEAIGPVNEWAVGMAGLLVMFVVVVLQSKIVYIALKWVGVVFSYSANK